MISAGQQAARGRRRLIWSAALSLPVALIAGGVIGAWAGNARIGIAIGAAIGFCMAIALLAAFAISAAARA